MSTRPEDFSARHIGITDADIASMLAELKFQNLEEFLQSIVPESILDKSCLLYTSPSPRDKRQSRMPSSA